jgi:hypothetical protein
MNDTSMEVRMRNVEDTLARIEGKLDRALTDISDHEARLRTLESRGGKRWDTLVGQIIGLAAAGFIGWLLGQV